MRTIPTTIKYGDITTWVTAASTEELIASVEKIAISIMRGATAFYRAHRDHEPTTKRIAVFSDLKEELQARGAWATVCDNNGWSHYANGSDFLA